MSFPRQVPLLYKLGHDLETRLGGSIFMYKGIPYRMSYESGIIRTNDIRDGSVGPKISPSDPDVDISSIELGYVNTYGVGDSDQNYPDRTAVFVTRLPYKQWKQGIHPTNVQLFAVDGDYISWGKESLLYSKGFAEMCMGQYPRMSLALTLRPGESVALSKDIAIKKSDVEVTGVYYKCKPVGYFDRRGTKFVPSGSLPEWFIDEVYRNAISVL